jgi:hypothetical protein
MPHHANNHTSTNSTIMDILIELPKIYASFKPQINQKLFHWIFTNGFQLLIIRHIRPEVPYSTDTYAILMRIVHLLSDGHGHMDGVGQDVLIRWLKENGIYQVDTFLRVLPFIPFEDLYCQHISLFTTHATVAGLEFYMCKMAVYTRPPCAQPIVQGRLPNQQHIGTYQPITAPNVLMSLNNIHHVIYTYVRCLITSSVEPMAHYHLL